MAHLISMPLPKALMNFETVLKSILMSKLFLSFVLSLYFFATSASAYEPPVPPEIQDYIKGQMINHEFLDAEFHEILETFHSWKENGPFPKHWGLRLNFNGDKVADWVGYLVDNSQTEQLPRKAVGLYCICSSGNSYSHYMLGDFSWSQLDDGVLFNLVKWPPKSYSNWDGSISVNITNDVVLVDTYLSPVGRIYYWNGPEVATLQISD